MKLGVLVLPTNDQVEAPTIMRALDPEVKDALWTAFEARLPERVDRHPLGCHRARASDRDCFEVMVVRLATGCSREDAERLRGNKVSDTTVRSRRDEWIAAGVFDGLTEEALSMLRAHAYAGCARRDVAGELRFRGDRHVDVVLRSSLACARIGHAYALH